MSHAGDKLREIKSFPSLVKYLRDELDWPVEQYPFDDLVFEWDAEELGIDPANAAKISDIKQLRPLSANQPWGIFFVKFEPKRLPIVALRRMLNQLVVKKRATARVAEQRAWRASDLLFISSYGEGEDRQLTFAHFRESPTAGDQAAASLRVLGWDGDDTALKLDAVAATLERKLRWTSRLELDVDAWRRNWSEAFVLRPREVIQTSKDLAIRLADLAKGICSRVLQLLEIESERGKLRQLHKAFQATLIHDMSAEDFADMYAQTITYGLFSAAVTGDPKDGLTADDIGGRIPITSPFLRELLGRFMIVGGRKGNIDFDELGAQEVVDLLNSPDTHLDAVLRDFGNKTRHEDPVVHFYELFLTAYDKKRKVQRGVFYTPQPVVSYIVRSVHELLQTEFGLADGLADTATWGEMAKRHAGLMMPEGMKPTDRFVTILDPATGTGTFLVEAIEVIHRMLVEKWKREGHGEKRILELWNGYVPKHLLPRLHGYELLMAPYAIAHLKIGLKLHETGYRFGSSERARIYLTNALEPAHDFSGRFEFAIPALAHESEAVNEVKRNQRFTVVIGNPPYSVLSANLSDEARALVERYRSVDGERIKEKSMLRLEMHLQDDYIKFVCISETAILRTGSGVVGMITNSGYLDSLSLRGMRYSLLKTFTQISLLNLHGSQQQATDETRALRDQNVFDIVQGVAVFLGVRSKASERVAMVHYAELVGEREVKYEVLSRACAADVRSVEAHPTSPRYYMVALDNEREEEFRRGTPVVDLFQSHVTGMVTAHDDLVIDFSDQALKEATRLLRDSSIDDSTVRTTLAVKDNAGWKLSKARARLGATDDGDHWYRDIDYRPFDRRRINYHPALVWSDRRELMQHMMRGKNIALSTCRQLSALPWTHVLVGRCLVESAFVSNKSREICHVMPLWFIDDDTSLLGAGSFAKPNLSAQAIRDYLRGTTRSDSAESLLGYMYAQFHSINYRARYAEFLKRDYPRVFAPRAEELFRELARLGGELIALHLVEAPAQQALSARFDKAANAWRYEIAQGAQRLPVTLSFNGPEKPVVGRIGWSDDTVWINAVKPRSGAADARVTGTVGFRGVPEEVWNFHIGGYQVCEKWLKDRKGRQLSEQDLEHYHKIVVALGETIRIMGEIDRVIDSHGGWPGAFA